MMKPSEFQTTIENQFDYICKVAMDDERKDYFKALSRQCKRETLFCDMDNYTVNLVFFRRHLSLPFPYF